MLANKTRKMAVLGSGEDRFTLSDGLFVSACMYGYT